MHLKSLIYHADIGTCTEVYNDGIFCQTLESMNHLTYSREEIVVIIVAIHGKNKAIETETAKILISFERFKNKLSSENDNI